jgi:hypothetical protein
MQDAYPWAALAPVAGLAVACLSHATISRLAGGRRQYTLLFLGFVVGLAAMLALSKAALSAWGHSVADSAALLAFNLGAYAALGYGYFHFVNLNMASLRIRMLQELLEAPQGMSREKLLQLYDVEEIVTNRIDRLTRAGQLVEKERRLHGGGRTFLLLARTMDTLRYIVLGRPGAARHGLPIAQAMDRGRKADDRTAEAVGRKRMRSA